MDESCHLVISFCFSFCIEIFYPSMLRAVGKTFAFITNRASNFPVRTKRGDIGSTFQGWRYPTHRWNGKLIIYSLFRHIAINACEWWWIKTPLGLYKELLGHFELCWEFIDHMTRYSDPKLYFKNMKYNLYLMIAPSSYMIFMSLNSFAGKKKGPHVPKQEETINPMTYCYKCWFLENMKGVLLYKPLLTLRL